MSCSLCEIFSWILFYKVLPSGEAKGIKLDGADFGVVNMVSKKLLKKQKVLFFAIISIKCQGQPENIAESF